MPFQALPEDLIIAVREDLARQEQVQTPAENNEKAPITPEKEKLELISNGQEAKDDPEDTLKAIAKRQDTSNTQETKPQQAENYNSKDPVVGANDLDTAVSKLGEAKVEAHLNSDQPQTVEDVLEATYQPPTDSKGNEVNDVGAKLGLGQEILNATVSGEQLANAQSAVADLKEHDPVMDDQTTRSEVAKKALQGLEDSGGLAQSEAGKVQDALTGKNRVIEFPQDIARKQEPIDGAKSGKTIDFPKKPDIQVAAPELGKVAA
jgi:hypothetical protein